MCEPRGPRRIHRALRAPVARPMTRAKLLMAERRRKSRHNRRDRAPVAHRRRPPGYQRKPTLRSRPVRAELREGAPRFGLRVRVQMLSPNSTRPGTAGCQATTVEARRPGRLHHRRLHLPHDPGYVGAWRVNSPPLSDGFPRPYDTTDHVTGGRSEWVCMTIGVVGTTRSLRLPPTARLRAFAARRAFQGHGGRSSPRP